MTWNESISLKYISTNNMAADLMTKALPRIKFEQGRNNLGMIFKMHLRESVGKQLHHTGRRKSLQLF